LTLVSIATTFGAETGNEGKRNRKRNCFHRQRPSFIEENEDSRKRRKLSGRKRMAVLWLGFVSKIMSITHEIWLRCKTDYLTGKGSLRVVAGRHGVAQSSIEKRARQEAWTRLRCEFEAAQLAKLLPPAPPTPPPVPIAPDGVVSSSWLAQRQEIYYRENAALVDKARGLLAKKLADEKNDLGTDGLAKLTSALGGIVDAENKLLGLNHRQKGKPRRSPPPMPEPIPTSEQPN
jgi:hypothetical protein